MDLEDKACSNLSQAFLSMGCQEADVQSIAASSRRPADSDQPCGASCGADDRSKTQSTLSRLWGAPATRQFSLIDGPPSSTARVQHVSTTQMLMGLAASAELQRRSA